MGADEAGDVWLLNGYGELARVKDWLVIPAPPGKTATRLAVVFGSNGTARCRSWWPDNCDPCILMSPAIATSKGSGPVAMEDFGS